MTSSSHPPVPFDATADDAIHRDRERALATKAVAVAATMSVVEINPSVLVEVRMGAQRRGTSRAPSRHRADRSHRRGLPASLGWGRRAVRPGDTTRSPWVFSVTRIRPSGSGATEYGSGCKPSTTVSIRKECSSLETMPSGNRECRLVPEVREVSADSPLRDQDRQAANLYVAQDPGPGRHPLFGKALGNTRGDLVHRVPVE